MFLVVVLLLGHLVAKGQSQKEVLVSSILPKNELEKVNFALAYCTGGEIFRSFFGTIEKTNSPSKINRPLDT